MGPARGQEGRKKGTDNVTPKQEKWQENKMLGKQKEYPRRHTKNRQVNKHSKRQTLRPSKW